VAPPENRQLNFTLRNGFIIDIVSYVKVKAQADRSLGSSVYLFLSAMHRYDAGRTLSVLHAAKLTTPQIAALEFTGEAQTVSTIAAWLGLSRPATSQLIDKLVRSGLVRRVEGTADRRQRNVTLSAKGRALIDRIAAARAARFDSSLAVLEPSLATRLGSILDEVTAALEKSAPSGANRTASSPARRRMP
jgi:DNA-binding MarR family transcriptional regulator